MHELMIYLVFTIIGVAIANFYHRVREVKKDTSVAKALLSLIIQISVFGLIALLLIHYNPSDKLAMKEKRQEAKEACQDFRLWIQRNNTIFEDSLQAGINHNDQEPNIWYSGGAVMNIIYWARGFREWRDRSIDSILLRLEKFKDCGCDPDTVDFDRKLPVRLDVKLKKYMDIHKDLYDPRELGLDTL